MGHYAKTEGKHAISIGESTIAAKDYSIALGDLSKANEGHSYAVGWECIANKPYSNAIGRKSVANAIGSRAIGNNVSTSAEWQTVIGKFNNDNYNALFIIGNGTDAENKNNAFEIKSSSIVINGEELTKDTLIELKKLAAIPIYNGEVV